MITPTMTRCAWCLSSPLYIHYHDHEWGKISHNDRHLFACLCLESMQAGLSWITVLNKRQAYYACFDGFDPAIIAHYDNNKLDELMNNRAIIRHKAKIQSIVNNAQAYLTVTKQSSFDAYLYGIINQYDQFPKDNKPISPKDIPKNTPASFGLAYQLKKDGFKFLGETTCYSFMQAVGMVNDHLMDCSFRQTIR